MENKKRLIDADALLSSVWLDSLSDEFDRARIKIIISTMPTVDAVEVVRCKDCKHALVHPFMADSQKLACTKSVNWRAVEPGHFCSYGERREGE